MVRRILHKSISFIWLLLISACLTPLDLPTENIGGKAVISGQVSNIEDQNFIQVGITAEKERLPYPYSGAIVKLLDDQGSNYTFSEHPDKPGIYVPSEGFMATAGITYRIEVTMDGKLYESATETMPDSPGTVETTYDFENKEYVDFEGYITLQNFMNLRTNSTLPSKATYLKWQIEEAFLLTPTDFPDIFGTVPPPCYIVQNADPQRIVLYNSTDFTSDRVEGLLIANRLVDWSFLERHYFTTYQSAITKDSYEYWRKVNTLAIQVGSIFDTPPAKLIGNIRNTQDPDEEVFGFFQATNQVFTRFFLLPQSLPFDLNVSSCTYNPNQNVSAYPSRCLDCLTQVNSSSVAPEWF